MVFNSLKWAIVYFVVAASGQEGEAIETIHIGAEPLHLTTESFDELVVDKETNRVKSAKPWFIKFYAPWCGHCKKLAPVWQELYDSANNQVNIAKVDCTADDAKELCQQFGVRGYPTLKFLKDDHFYNYKQARILPNLQEFVLNEGYLLSSEEDQDEIPRRLAGMEKFKKESADFAT